MIYPWHQSALQEIHNYRQQRRLPQALLLHGNKGLGKQEFARYVASSLLCVHYQNEPCRSCRDCQLCAVANHPDLFIIGLAEKSKIIKVDQIRDLVAQLGQTSYRSGYQVVIIDPAERMNRAAANSLLKTLEEPVGQVVFMLICNQTADLPATIVSRCHHLFFNACSDPSGVVWLQQRLNINEREATLLLTLANHAPLLAVKFHENDFLSLRNTVLQAVLNILRQQDSAIRVAEILMKWSLEQVVIALTAIVTDVLRLHCGAFTHISNQDCVVALEQLQRLMPKTQVLQLLEEIIQAQRLINQSSSINVQLLLEGLLLQCSLIPIAT